MFCSFEDTFMPSEEKKKLWEQKLTSVSTPSYPVGYCGCSSCFESPKYKEDCYFYGETRDMGAIIRFCTREKIEWGHCPCEKCDKFLSKEEVDRVARLLMNMMAGGEVGWG